MFQVSMSAGDLHLSAVVPGEFEGGVSDSITVGVEDASMDQARPPFLRDERCSRLV